jgi:UDP-glucuronate 4-epimerase
LKYQKKNPNFYFIEADIRKYSSLESQLLDKYNIIIHLAAKAGVLPSIQHPIEYTETNINGTQNLLEFAKDKNIQKFIFGSSSSIYGVNPNVPWREDENVLSPISPYAATKVSGELMGKVYSNLYGIQFLALRFFTVYGPRQRPDLAIHKFTKLIDSAMAIPFYGDGLSKRDYTYIDDIISGIIGAINYTGSLYEVFNLGNNKPVNLNELIKILGEIINIEPKLDFMPQQPGDVPLTCADINKATERLNYSPSTSLKDGLTKFYHWFKEQYV